ncbi:unnamed protein product [Brachionus calyciflorus]|uniref:RING-type domain-containing protein n=1 Tax=Brachionus calyciflorus TaxID=104777 RepID=A0A813LYS0_9BILA|nr:unnamed protein product [Brachionus calyciflorus]
MYNLFKSTKSLVEARPCSHKQVNSQVYRRNNSISLLDSIVKIDIYPIETYLSDLSISVSPSSSTASFSDISQLEVTKKQKKWTYLPKSFLSFKVKRNENNNLYYMNNSNGPENEPEIDSDPGDEKFYTQKIQSKNVKLKKLIKTKQLKSAKSPSILLNSDLSKKKNSKFIFLKYNLYKNKFVDYYFNQYISKLERARHIYSIRKIGSKSQEFLIENKKYFKSIKLVERLLDEENSQKFDSPILNRFTIDHNRVNEEFEQNYDQMYLDFLISLQHREITPEDYEYLSRLDDLIKKKTIKDNVLNKLKTRIVDEEFLECLNGDVCGICMDEYELDQVCKYLPCGHRFHSDCIDNWLKDHSTTCPLDNLSIEEQVETNTYEFDVQDLLYDMVDEIEKNLELENEVDSVIQGVLDQIEFDYL